MKILKIYIDESGVAHTFKPKKEQKIFVLSGILIEASKYPKIKEEVNKFKRDNFGTTKIILHWYDIKNQRKPFNVLRDRKKRAKFYKELEKLYSKLPFCHINALINQCDLYDRYQKKAWHPYYYGLKIIMDRAYLHAEDYNFKRIDLIAEGISITEDQYLRDEHAKLLKLGSVHRTGKEFKEFGFSLKIFKKKQNINGLQIADLTASLIRKAFLDREKGRELPKPYLFVKKKYRKSRSGQSKGFGLIRIP